MDFDDLIRRARSYRRFSQNDLPQGFLAKMVGYARLSPSSGNQQFLKFLTIREKENRDVLFPLLKWARALPDWEGPAEHEGPTGYVVILLDKRISTAPSCDHGIAGQSMVLGAAAEGVGCCMIGAFGKQSLREALSLEDHLDPCLVLAFGYPGEIVVAEEMEDRKNTSYYRDEQDRHHVPKRPLRDLLISEK